ncbi:Vacuolar protein sorting-associated protein 62 [Exophiala xenobiotica]
MSSIRPILLLLYIGCCLSFPLTSIIKRDVPDFVRQYAPVAYLCSTEIYLPSDIGAQIVHTHPEDVSGATITPPAALTLSNLDSLNAFADSGTNVYLTSNEGIKALPSWFRGTDPQADGSTPSTVASAIVAVTKPNDTLDAFYFYFYAYNQGNWVLGSPALEFGDHVGDWEHTMVRFVSGAPTAVYYSQHSGGEAFTYAATEKGPDGVRPVAYVANGTHANYATAGPHDHTIPNLNTEAGPLTDHTDKGPFWDPLLSAYLYSYDNSTGVFAAYNGVDPTGWLNFAGRWGDNELPDSTPGQMDVFGEKKYVAGPTGPRDKSLGRTAVCPDGDSCDIKSSLGP